MTKRLLQAIQQEVLDRPPVWMMRQAGRYLPEYRALREKARDFIHLCENSDWVTEVTLQPLRRFPLLDAAIIFSDILLIPRAMGMPLQFVAGEGPKFSQPLRSLEAVHALYHPDAEVAYASTLQALQMVRRALPQEKTLIGFCGSPWTLACYMVQGEGSDDFFHAKKMWFTQPDIMQALLACLVTAVADAAIAQLNAGAEFLMLFDTWGGILPYEDYKNASLSSVREVLLRVRAFNPDVPVLLFTKGGGMWLSDMADAGFDALGVDWQTSMAFAKTQVKDKVCLQGNIDPLLLFAEPKTIQHRVRELCALFPEHRGHMLNLGHGIVPETPISGVEAMLEALVV